MITPLKIRLLKKHRTFVAQAERNGGTNVKKRKRRRISQSGNTGAQRMERAAG
jgi:hypothetical protein